MTRYIDADALKRKAQKVATEAWKMRIKSSVETILNQFIDWIEDMPTINAVEVVRCKECRKQGSDDCPMFNREWRTIMRSGECVDDFIFHDLTKPSGFCNYGERNANG